MKISFKEKLTKVLNWIHSPELHNSEADTETNFRAVRDDTGASVSLGVGTGGENHGVFSDSLNQWLILGNSNYVDIPCLRQYLVIGPETTVNANSTLWFTVAPPPEIKPIAVVGYYWYGLAGNAGLLNIYNWALSASGASFAVANSQSSACRFKPYVRFLAYRASGTYNILRGTKAPNMGTGAWSSATWRTSGSGSSITAVEISDSPVEGVTKALKIVTNTGSSADYGYAQDEYVMFDRVGSRLTYSVWLKGPIGAQVRLQPYWNGTSGEAESHTEYVTLDTAEWKRYPTTSPAIQYDHQNLSVGYVYSQTPNATIYVCAPMLEWGTEAHDWTPSLYND